MPLGLFTPVWVSDSSCPLPACRLGSVTDRIAFFAAMFPNTQFLLFFVVPMPAWLFAGGIFAVCPPFPLYNHTCLYPWCIPPSLVTEPSNPQSHLLLYAITDTRLTSSTISLEPYTVRTQQPTRQVI